ncbi:hypothetical protein [Cotesia plutellae polydnavirus]|nr:hypothetical protein [Cotesia plutellae polydnavirus]AEE09486.1 conserved hypothetical protein [Cotesia vestalis bracovirus]AEE09491.1 conserved hypothetical protein [Cotesia vestalis bracovirus]
MQLIWICCYNYTHLLPQHIFHLSRLLLFQQNHFYACKLDEVIGLQNLIEKNLTDNLLPQEQSTSASYYPWPNPCYHNPYEDQLNLMRQCV